MSGIATTEAAQQKADHIKASSAENDLPELVRLATSEGGLLNDDLRRDAWPVLLGCPIRTEDARHREMTQHWKKLPEHRDEGQVRLDVDRSFVYDSNNERQEKLDHWRHELQSLITEVLRRHPFLCYFQGYHDIVQVFLLVLGRDAAYEAVARLSLLRVRDFMLPSLDPSLAHLRLLPAILHRADPDVARHLAHTEPFFALSATLTLYAHDIEEYSDIARLFDFLIAHEAVVAVYLFAIIVMSRRTELLEIEPDEPEMMHSILSKLPKPLDLEKLITDTMILIERYPPESLSASNWRWISSYSVLKSTRNPQALARQTLEDGRKMYIRQADQLKMIQRLKVLRSQIWRIRRPAVIGVLIVFAAYGLRRNDPSAPFASFWHRLRMILPG